MKLPIHIDGAPLGTVVVVEMMLAEVTPPNGKPWNTFLLFGGAPPGTLWYEADVDRSLFEQVKGTPVRVHLTIQLTVLGNPHTQEVPLGDGPQRVPGFGLCEPFTFPIRPSLLSLDCRAAFRQPAYVLARFDGLRTEAPSAEGELTRAQWHTHYSPYPADFGIDPISVSNWFVPKGATSVTFTTMKPLAHIYRELDIPNLQLAEFAN